MRFLCVYVFFMCFFMRFFSREEFASLIADWKMANNALDTLHAEWVSYCFYTVLSCFYTAFTRFCAVSCCFDAVSVLTMMSLEGAWRTPRRRPSCGRRSRWRSRRRRRRWRRPWWRRRRRAARMRRRSGGCRRWRASCWQRPSASGSFSQAFLSTTHAIFVSTGRFARVDHACFMRL